MKPKSKIASFFNALFIDFHHFKLIQRVEGMVAKMSISEKILFYSVSIVLAVTSLTMLYRTNEAFMVEIPGFGGSFIEGITGSPRFINPVLAISDTDKDLSSIIYSGLLKTRETGGFEPDLAASYEISEDGTVYEFFIREDAHFHDGKKVTSDDVLFTIEKVMDPVIKSPKRNLWEGVTVEKIDDRQIRFILKKPYAPFLQVLTLGILPKHIWENASSEEFPFSEFNLNPIGSGPYKISKVSKNSGGIPTSIILEAYDKYTLGKPHIKTITFKFFQNEEALVKAYEEDSIESVAGIGQDAASKLIEKDAKISKTSLPRVFGIFFNQNLAPVLLKKEVRVALDMATPKQRIVDEVLSGFGKVLSGPTPTNVEEDIVKAAGNAEAAKNYLIEKGWEENEDGILEREGSDDASILRFSITTSNTPELKRTAEILQEAWKNMGADVSIKVFESGDLSQNVIKSRRYDALLFGEVISEEGDLYPFWHSSERNDPGLNISLYANITVDKALEEMQGQTDETKKAANREVVFSEIKNDVPAIFLFAPDFLYIPSPKVQNILLKNTSYQNERFLSLSKWFIETDKVWRFFTNI
jgi:peptide/nickel transport system substrate-binding protein